MRRLIKLQAPRKKNKDEYPDISSKDFINYLMHKTNTGTISELSSKIPFSQSYLNSVFNLYTPLTSKFINKVKDELNFEIDNYNEWLTSRDKEDPGRSELKKKKRNDFDQTGFLKFVEEIAEKKGGLKRQDIIDILGISRTLWDNMLSEKTPLTSKTLSLINNKLGIGKNEFEYYLTDPKNMIDYITSRELEELSKQYHKGQLVNQPTGYSKFLETVTGLTSEQLRDEIGQNPQTAIRKENGKISIPKNLVEKVKNKLGLSFDDYKEYKSNPGDISKFQNEQIKKLQLKYAPKEKNPKSKKELQNIDTRQFVDFLLASTNLSASKVSKALGFPSSKLTTMKNSNSKLTNQFIQKVEEKLGLTIEDFYAYQEDPSNLKSVTVEVDESESVNYDTKKMYDKRKAPDYVDAKTYIEFLVKATGKKVTAIPGELGLSHSYLSNIKQGKTPLYMELIKNVQAVFGLTINDYYTYTQSGEVPNLNQNQESVESQPLLDLTKQSQFLTFICFLEETNIANIASDTGYSLQDMVEINAGRLQIDQNFIDAINECYSIDSLNQFNSIVGNGIINMYDIQDLRNQGFQEVAPTKE